MAAISVAAATVSFAAFASSSATAAELEVMASWPNSGNLPAEVIDVAAAPDGGAWFTEARRNALGYVSAAASLHEYSLPGSVTRPESIAVAADGSVWATAIAPDNEHEVIVHRLKSGKIKAYTMKSPGMAFNGGGSITEGSDGNVWFTLQDAGGGHIGRFTPKGQLTLFPLPTAPYNSGEQRPFDITAGPDGALWFTDQLYPTTAEIGRMTTSGEVTYFPYQTTGSTQDSITTGPDGALWFVDQAEEKIRRITTSGDMTSFSVGEPHVTPWPDHITAGPDGAMWYTTGAGLGRLETNGGYSLIPENIEGGGISLSPSGALWIANRASDQIDRYKPKVSPQPTYVALGDSYSSGEGNPPFEEGTAIGGETPDRCHRSATAYGPLLDEADALGPMLFNACSGAVTNDMFEGNAVNVTEPAQRIWVSHSTKTVTLTIGGNDAGFRWAIEKCISFPPIPALVRFGCSRDTEFEAETQDRLTALAGGPYATTPPPLSAPIHSIESVLEALHANAPSAHIYIGLYPSLFGKRRNRYSEPLLAPGILACEVGPNLWLSYEDAMWLNQRGEQLNRIISAAVKSAHSHGVQATPITPAAFHGHAFCDKSAPWFYPVSLEVPIHLLPELEAAISGQPGSLHPTEEGQRAYETAFAAKVK